MFCERARQAQVCFILQSSQCSYQKIHPPIPRDEMFDELGRERNLYRIDLKTGLRQIRVRKEVIEKLALKPRYGQFEYFVNPYGLCNARATFQSVMNDIFRDKLDGYFTIIIADLLIYSNWEEAHFWYSRNIIE